MGHSGGIPEPVSGTRWMVRMIRWELAGVVGFEPTVHGTKNRCLTAWLHPNRAALATQSVTGDQAPASVFRKGVRAIPAGPRGAADRRRGGPRVRLRSSSRARFVLPLRCAALRPESRAGP